MNSKEYRFGGFVSDDLESFMLPEQLDLFEGTILVSGTKSLRNFLTGFLNTHPDDVVALLFMHYLDAYEAGDTTKLRERAQMNQDNLDIAISEYMEVDS